MEKVTVLIVDADKSSAMLLEEVVKLMYQESADVRILKTANGSEALKFCHEYQIELVLTEIKIREMNGWELTRKIKALDPSIPIIIQTAIVLDHTEQKFKNSGADGFMAKPVGIDKIQKNIQRVL
ncbi:MAG: response regulator [Bacteroidota bacterium]